MAVRLKPGKAKQIFTQGQVREAGKYRDVVVVMRLPNLIGFRAKGCKTIYWLTVEACYYKAVEASVALEKREKQKLKKQKGK